MILGYIGLILILLIGLSFSLLAVYIVINRGTLSDQRKERWNDLVDDWEYRASQTLNIITKCIAYVLRTIAKLLRVGD